MLHFFSCWAKLLSFKADFFFLAEILYEKKNNMGDQSCWTTKMVYSYCKFHSLKFTATLASL